MTSSTTLYNLAKLPIWGYLPDLSETLDGKKGTQRRESRSRNLPVEAPWLNLVVIF